MKIVTTVHKAGFEQYGYRWLESIANWPQAAEFVIYPEGFTREEFAYEVAKHTRNVSGWPDVENLRAVPADEVWRLKAFKERMAQYKAPSWRYDIVRFSNKVFAAHHALYEHDGIGVWLDADCVTYRKVPEGYIEELLGDAYIAHFARAGHYTETGMWIMNCAHPEHRAFMDTWLQWFEADAFKQLHEWHDCTTLDATLRLFLKDGRITTRNLSGEFSKSMHPMAMNPAIARYWDHCKGQRKALGYSPENTERQAA